MRDGRIVTGLRDVIARAVREEAAPPEMAPPEIGDFELNPKDRTDRGVRRGLRSAAVLVPLVQHPEGMTVLLTRRTDHLDQHAGQISFPGGGTEEHDDNAIETALRETKEEIGLHRQHVRVAGFLDPYETGTGYHITPVVGFVTPGFALTADTFEVAEIFEVPVAFIFDPENHKRHSGFWDGRERHYHAMPYGNYYIWGATAGMLMNLYRRVQGLL